jgi:hypothetical protein
VHMIVWASLRVRPMSLCRFDANGLRSMSAVGSLPEAKGLPAIGRKRHD